MVSPPPYTPTSHNSLTTPIIQPLSYAYHTYAYTTIDTSKKASSKPSNDKRTALSSPAYYIPEEHTITHSGSTYTTTGTHTTHSTVHTRGGRCPPSPTKKRALTIEPHIVLFKQDYVTHTNTNTTLVRPTVTKRFTSNCETSFLNAPYGNTTSTTTSPTATSPTTTTNTSDEETSVNTGRTSNFSGRTTSILSSSGSAFSSPLASLSSKSPMNVIVATSTGTHTNCTTSKTVFR